MGALAFLPEHDKAIKSFAFKAWRRAQSAGARSLQIEDVQQELYMVWCVARDIRYRILGFLNNSYDARCER